jgi:hypothetical protein
VYTYLDPIKEESRQRVLTYLHQFFRNQPKQNLSVLCFPGAEATGQEGLEIKSIYDPFGIPRANIVGLERDKVKANRLKDANLGIIVENSDDEIYFAQTSKQFDIVFLDYTGQQTSQNTRALELLVGRHLLKPRSVIITNYSARREAKHIQMKYLYRNNDHLNQSKPLELIKLIEDAKAGKVSYNLDDIREGITDEVLRILAMSKGLLEFPKVVAYNPLAKELFEQFRNKILPESRLDLNYGRVEKVLESVGLESANPYWGEHVDVSPHANYLNSQITNQFILHLTNKINAKEFTGPQRTDLAKLAVWLEWRANNGSYFLESNQRYSYTSNKNSLMLLDIFGINQRPDIYSEGRRLFSLNVEKGELKIHNDKQKTRKYLREVERFNEKFAKLKEQKKATRIDLGSSYVRPKKLTKKKAYKLLEEGLSPEELSSEYQNFTLSQLRAFKAWITMRKTKNNEG